MPTPPTLEKAKLKWSTVVPPMWGTLECQFNPSTLSISKENEWSGESTPSFNAPYVHFAGGKAATYSLELFFDSYEHNELSAQEQANNTDELSKDKRKDVREYTNQLLRLMLRGAGYAMFLIPYASPPTVTFVWGKITLFKAVITKVDITYTMFAPDGTPIRAKANVSFQQRDFWDDILPAQNPTSRTDPRKTRMTYARQRLDQIAFEEYGDARYWRVLAEANQLEDPFDMKDGQLLVIPPIDGTNLG